MDEKYQVEESYVGSVVEISGPLFFTFVWLRYKFLHQSFLLFFFLFCCVFGSKSRCVAP